MEFSLFNKNSAVSGRQGVDGGRGPNLLVLALSLSLSIIPPALGAYPAGSERLTGHMPHASLLAQCSHLGRLAGTEVVTLSLTLPLRDPAGLADFLVRQKDPSDPLFGQYLTPEQFADRFGPSQDEYDQVARFVGARGLSVTSTHASRLVLTVAGSAADVESAFQLELHQYRQADGKRVRAPSTDPAVPHELLPHLSGVIGLDTVTRHTTHLRKTSDDSATAHGGSGPGGGLSPADIKRAYQLDTVNLSGGGQTLALFELDGFHASDITTYANHFGISPAPALQTVLIDGYDGSAGQGADEVTLDIELMMAVANGASKIMVYEGPNSDQGVIDTYARIASDNQAKLVSTSWGAPELSSTQAALNAEQAIFMQMAAQGQSIFAASGDSGAYDDGSTLSVDDPGTQPYVTSVGGTRLSIAANGSYLSESTWGAPALTSKTTNGGGGGISAVWPIPSWQQGLANASNKGSTHFRMVPDVSLDADPSTGYAIFSGGQWGVFGGTSCAAPLWAAFTALVNQQRTGSGLSFVGYFNPVIYQVARSLGSSSLIHDVADLSKNLFYSAVAGYDMATGWGSFIGSALINALSSANLPPMAPAGLSFTASSNRVALSWSASTGAATYQVRRGTASGGPYVLIGAATAATSYVDTAVSNGTGYFYVVTAINSAGESGFSTEVSVTPDVAAPAAPSAVTVQML